MQKLIQKSLLSFQPGKQRFSIMAHHRDGLSVLCLAACQLSITQQLLRMASSAGCSVCASLQHGITRIVCPSQQQLSSMASLRISSLLAALEPVLDQLFYYPSIEQLSSLRMVCPSISSSLAEAYLSVGLAYNSFCWSVYALLIIIITN